MNLLPPEHELRAKIERRDAEIAALQRDNAALRVERAQLRVGGNAALGTLQSLAAEHTYGFQKLAWALAPDMNHDPDLDDDSESPYNANGNLIRGDFEDGDDEM